MILKTIFSSSRIVGLAGIKNSGKTNNLIYLLQQLPRDFKDVYFYGMCSEVTTYLLKKGYKEISSLNHLIGKRNSLIILDEFQKLHLNDRRNKDVLNQVIDFIYHNNNYLLLSSPNIREFNSIIGGVIEKWLLKTVALNQCVNGSQLKEIVKNYRGRYKQLSDIVTSKSELILYNDDCEQIINCKYIEAVDNKRQNFNIFQDKNQDNIKTITKTNQQKLI